MNVLMVGVLNGKGSWQVRGQQLGAALGARVTTQPTAQDWRWAEVIVLVKRAYLAWLAQAQATRAPIVWDALDCWRQPAENHVGEAQALALLRRQQAQIRPVLTVAATQAMAAACGGVYLPHHAWASLVPTPASPRVSVVGYEGNPVYLGQWKVRLEKACQARGWRFVVNPQDVSTADVIVSFRDGPWDGWICREWKSGVKVVNAIAAGRPFIGQASAAVRELCPPGSVVESVKDLDAALDAWTPYDARAAAVETCQGLAPAGQLAVVAARYRELLQTVEARCAA